MKNRQVGFTLIELLIIIPFLCIVLAWGINMYKLTQCDFETPYRCELLHGLGVMPPMALITVWVDTDNP